jgi:hypothetical protein
MEQTFCKVAVIEETVQRPSGEEYELFKGPFVWELVAFASLRAVRHAEIQGCATRQSGRAGCEMARSLLA